MASMWRRTMLYLGLGPDDEYEDDMSAVGGVPEPAAARAVTPRPAVKTAARPPAKAAPSGRAPVGARPRPAPAASSAPAVPGTPVAPGGAAVRPLPTGGDPAPKPKPVVRQVPAAAKPYVVSPTHFNHSQEVADRFKANQPVIVNLQQGDRELSRRIIDFCSGLCYGLGGHMEKVAQHVYLLTPSNVEVSVEERRRLHERGLYDA